MADENVLAPYQVLQFDPMDVLRRIGRGIAGTPEVVGTMASGFASMPEAGFAGLTVMGMEPEDRPMGFIINGKWVPSLMGNVPMPAASAVEHVMTEGGALTGGTFMPRSEYGMENLEDLGGLVENVMEPLTRVTDETLQRGMAAGIPAALLAGGLTAVQGAAESFPGTKPVTTARTAARLADVPEPRPAMFPSLADAGTSRDSLGPIAQNLARYDEGVATRLLDYDAKMGDYLFGGSQRGAIGERPGSVRRPTAAEQEGMLGDDWLFDADFAPDDIVAGMKDYFGTTDNFMEAGYIMNDGSMLDLSGSNMGGMPGSRSLDHREIPYWDKYGPDTGSATPAMRDFQKTVNAIRIDFNSNIGSTNRMPTSSQLQTMADGFFGKEAIVEFVHPETGSIVASATFDSPSKGQLRRFFNEANEQVGPVRSPLLPERLYHGSNTMFDEFEGGRVEQVFTSSSADESMAYGTKNFGEVEVDSKKPADLVNDQALRQKVIDEFNEGGGWGERVNEFDPGGDPLYTPGRDSMMDIIDAPDNNVNAMLEDMGYDSVMFREGDKPGDVTVMAKPELVRWRNRERGSIQDTGAGKQVLGTQAGRTGLLNLPEQKNTLSQADFIYNESLPGATPRSQRIFDVGLEFNEKALDYWGGKPMEMTPENAVTVANNMTEEALAAYAQRPEMAGWYKANLDEAMTHAAKIHPELATDPQSQSAFKFIMAVTSNGQEVPINASLTNQYYRQWRETGEFPIAGSGKEINTMKDAFSAANRMVDDLGYEGFDRFLDQEFTVGELNQAGYKISGENVDTVVKGSAIFGPKIGGGFMQNLRGNFDPPTFDRWWQRTYGRHSGTLIAPETVIGAKIETFTQALEDVPREAFASLGMTKKQALENPEEAARLIHAEFARGGFKNKTEVNNAARNLMLTLANVVDAPAGGSQREYMRGVIEQVRDNMRAQGIEIDTADVQALLWYAEKDLYAKMGGTVNTETVDYATVWKRLAEEAD